MNLTSQELVVLSDIVNDGHPTTAAGKVDLMHDIKELSHLNSSLGSFVGSGYIPTSAEFCLIKDMNGDTPVTSHTKTDFAHDSVQLTGLDAHTGSFFTNFFLS